MSEKKTRQAVSRRMQREMAVQLLFEMKAQKEENQDFIESYFETREMKKEEYAYVELIARSYIEHMDEIEKLLAENIHRWRVERVGKTEISIIRVATTEMLYIDDVPVPVSINEAVELAKRFADEKAYKFVNKVLKNILEATSKEKTEKTKQE